MHSGAAKDLSLKHGPIGDLFESEVTSEANAESNGSDDDNCDVVLDNSVCESNRMRF